MNTPKGKCASCGAPTEVINRRIGFFGLQETHCTHCRDCLPQAAAQQGLDPKAILAEHDAMVEDTRESRRQYEERKASKKGR